MVRAFVGIPLDTVARRQVKQAIAPLVQKLGDRVRWIHPNNWHITVRFLGNVNTVTLDAMSQAVAREVKQIQKFVLTIKKIAGFPSSKSRIVAAHVESHPLLETIFTDLDEAGETMELPREGRAFKPHITVAKYRFPHQVDTIELDSITMMANKLVLYKSEPMNEGSHYTPLAKFPFV